MTLRVILQIVTFGEEDKVREIGRIDIHNKGPIEGGIDVLNYDLCKYEVIDLTPRQAGQYELEITHRRRWGAWRLVRKVLEVFDIEGPQ